MLKSPRKFTVTFEPIGRRIEIPEGETILAAAQQIDTGLLATCGGQGTCLDCKVRLLAGTLNDLTYSERENLAPEEVTGKTRLACQAIPESDAIVDLPAESISTRQRLQIEVLSSPFILDQPTRVIQFSTDGDITLPEKLAGFTAEKSLSLSSELIHLIRPVIESWPSTQQSLPLIVQNQTVVGCLENDPPLGLAVDVGTTKLAAYLINMTDGTVLASDGRINPQIAYGEDIISRISYANSSSEHEIRLRQVLRDGISQLSTDLCSRINAQMEQVIEVVLVGNSVIQHFLAGFPVRSLGESPFSLTQSTPLWIPAKDFGFHFHSVARVYLPPLIAGYVGGDHIAMLVASGSYPPADRVLAMDIGTNTEISLIVGNKIFSCSCASGPAFEGARIREGMRASPGAIERVRQHDGQIRLHTIDHRPPAGICGSGILDAIVVLREIDAIDKRGMFQKEHPAIQDYQGQKTIPLVDSYFGEGVAPVRIYRQDIQEIQLAKAAIRTGCDILMEQAGIQPDDIQQMLVAGAFGTYLSIDSALRIGMFPPIPVDRIQQIGNAAGKGAQMLLCSQSARQKALDIAANATLVELNRQSDFTDRFTKNLQLPK